MNEYAITVTSKEKAELLEIGAPPALNPNEIRGRTICSLISPGTELAWNYCGKNFPTVPGYSAVFKVEESGGETGKIEKGAFYFCMGNHKSFQQCGIEDAVKVPEGLPPETAVLARLIGVSMTTLTMTAARPGDIVVVTGAGPVGYLAAQIFSISGYEVIIVEPDAGRRRIAEGTCGLKSFEKMPLDDKSICGKVAIVVECSGHEQAVLDACRAVRKRGEVVLLGVPWQRKTELYAHELLYEVFHKYVVLRSGWEWELPLKSSDFHPHSIIAGYGTALNWLSRGAVKTEGLSTLINPRNPQDAYQDLLNRRSKGLFSIFDWRKI